MKTSKKWFLLKKVSRPSAKITAQPQSEQGRRRLLDGVKRKVEIKTKTKMNSLTKEQIQTLIQKLLTVLTPSLIRKQR